jgi:hypothetical protein
VTEPHTIRVTSEGPIVVWVLDGKRLLSIPWQGALDLANAMRAQVRAAKAYALEGTTAIEPEVTVTCGGGSIAVRQEGSHVLFIGNGQLLFGMPWNVAEDLWRGTISKTRLCEEMANADQVTHDAAILHRAGSFFGLTDSPVIKAEALKEAVHNRELRRFMPMSIKSAEVIGAPTVVMGSRPADVRLRSLVRRMSIADRKTLFDKLNGAPRSPS